MNKLKILCFVLGSFYLFQGMASEVRATFSETLTGVGAGVGSAVDAAQGHKKDGAHHTDEVPVE